MQIRQFTTPVIQLSTYTPGVPAANLAQEVVAGNILLLVCTIDKSAGSLTPNDVMNVANNATSKLASIIGASASGFIVGVKATGGETGTISATLSAAHHCKVQLVEIEGNNLNIDTVQNAIYDNNSVATMTCTATGATGATTIGAIALVGNDSAKSFPTNPEPTTTWTNGFTMHSRNWVASSGIGEPGFETAINLNLTPETTPSTVFTATANSNPDQMVALIMFFSEAASNLTLGTVPANNIRGAARQVGVSNPATAPTTANTTIRLVDNSGPAMTVTLVTNQGGGNYLITYTVPTSLAIKNSATGYPMVISVAGENVSTGNISLAPLSSRNYTDIVTPDGGAQYSLISAYSAFTPVATDQAVFDQVTSTGETITVNSSGVASFTPALSQDCNFDFFFVQNDGTIGASQTYNIVTTAESIVSVNGGNPIPLDATAIPIVLTGDGTGVGAITIGGVAQSFTIQSPTLVTIDSLNPPLAKLGVIVTVALDNINTTANTAIAPDTGWAVVDIDETYNILIPGTVQANAVPQVGTQIIYQISSTSAATITMTGNGRPTANNGNPGSFNYKFLDITDFAIGSVGTYTFVAAGAAPTISAQPSNATVENGNMHSFSVTASGTGGVTYQWLRNGIYVIGATSNTHQITAGTAGLNGGVNGDRFRCIVQDSNGSIWSTEAILTVTIGGSTLVKLSSTMQNVESKALLTAGNYQAYVLPLNSIETLALASPVVTPNAQGVGTIQDVDTTLGVVGTTRLVAFKDSVSGEWHIYPTIVEGV